MAYEAQVAMVAIVCRRIGNKDFLLFRRVFQTTKFRNVSPLGTVPDAEQRSFAYHQ